MSPALRWGIYGSILALATFLRWPVPEPAWPHFDEAAFTLLPLGFWSGDLNPHFFNYPALQFYLVSVVYGVVFLWQSVVADMSLLDFLAWNYLVDDGELRAVARSVTTVMSVATVAVVGRAGTILYGPRAGMAAALLLATLPMAARFGHLAMVDTPAVLWIACAILWAARFLQEPQTHHLVVAGLFAGVAAATKYPAGLVLLPVLTAAVGQRSAMKLVLPAVAAAVGFVLLSPFAVLDAGATWAHLQDMARSHLLGAAAPPGSPRPSSGPIDVATQLYFAVGWPVVLVVPGLGLAVVERDRRDRMLAVGTVLFVAFAMASTSTFMRYLLPLGPFVSLLLARLLTRRVGPPRQLVVVVCLTAVVPAWASLQTRQLLAGDDTREQAVAWLSRHAPDGGRLAEPESPCGRLPLLTPDRVLVRQAHFLRSFDSGQLVAAYGALAQRQDLPPLYTPDRPMGTGPRARVTVVHPLCAASGGVDRSQESESSFYPGDIATAVFDPQDWLFVPVAGFTGQRFSGPQLHVAVMPDGSHPLPARAFFAAMADIHAAHDWIASGDAKRARAAYEHALTMLPRPEAVFDTGTAAKMHRTWMVLQRAWP